MVQVYESENGGCALSYQTQHLIITHTRWINLKYHLKELGLESKLFDPSPVLEVGCGDGSYLAGLLMHHPDKSVIGIDIDEDCLLYGKHRFGDKIKLVHGNIINMPFEDESFMFVYSNSLYDLIPEWQKERSAREISRVLKPEGIYVTNKGELLRKRHFKEAGLIYIPFEKEIIFIKPKKTSPSQRQLASI
jgi:ubiquinone/menaquinone biosynthesis C-methylase UbiE